MALSPTVREEDGWQGFVRPRASNRQRPKGVQGESDYFGNSKSPIYSNKLNIQINWLIHFLDINIFINFTVKKILSYSYTADNAHKYQ